MKGEGSGWHRESRRHAEAAVRGIRRRAGQVSGSIKSGLSTRRGKLAAAAVAAGVIGVVIFRRRKDGYIEAAAAFSNPEGAEAFAVEMLKEGHRVRVIGSEVVVGIKRMRNTRR